MMEAIIFITVGILFVLTSRYMQELRKRIDDLEDYTDRLDENLRNLRRVTGHN